MAKDGRIRLVVAGSSRMKDQRDGHYAGTPWYASSEQLDRGIDGVGTDVYAVGMMTYRLLIVAICAQCLTAKKSNAGTKKGTKL